MGRESAHHCPSGMAAWVVIRERGAVDICASRARESMMRVNQSTTANSKVEKSSVGTGGWNPISSLFAIARQGFRRRPAEANAQAA